MRRLVLFSVALLSALSLAAVAQAGGVTSSLTIKTHTNGGYLDGKLKSSKASCEKGQTVQLKYQANGATGFQTVRKPKTDDQGYWKQNAPGGTIPPGKYYAKVKGKDGCPTVKTSKVSVSPV